MKQLTRVGIPEKANAYPRQLLVVMFMDEGQVIEIAAPDDLYNNPQHERTKLFLSKILAMRET